MVKYKLILILLFGVMALILLFVFFVGSFTSKYDPILECKTQNSVSDVMSKLVEYAKYKDMKIEMTDTIYDDENKIAVQSTLRDNRIRVSYEVYDINDGEGKNRSEIKLIEIYDYRTQIGCYTIESRYASKLIFIYKSLIGNDLCMKKSICL